jgi:hypothetical protein
VDARIGMEAVAQALEVEAVDGARIGQDDPGDRALGAQGLEL